MCRGSWLDGQAGRSAGSGATQRTREKENQGKKERGTGKAYYVLDHIAGVSMHK